ncbi:hypothetical protein [Spirosoma agri]|uniref:Uncharacterized protein n=1 Tax=Spirosoma agri TaxID=1987381 RepID=A0A6M0IPR3_9BACT|nr:hypothetical protein [Spirosoma agri]NEU70370.1 hypothetical protein [Spirosoma agri]
MQPIRYVIHQHTIWYSVTEYARLLLDTHTMSSDRPSTIRKRRHSLETAEPALLAKLNQSGDAYQIQIDQKQFADRVVFEHLHWVLKPFHVRPADWTNPASLFHEIQVYIDRTKRSIEPDVDSVYCKKIESKG